MVKWYHTTVMHIKVNLWAIWSKEKANNISRMATFTKDNSSKANGMEEEKLCFPTQQ